MQVELDDDSKYLVFVMGSISFLLQAREVFERHEVLYVFGLTKNLPSVCCQLDLKFMAKFK